MRTYNWTYTDWLKSWEHVIVTVGNVRMTMRTYWTLGKMVDMRTYKVHAEY